MNRIYRRVWNRTRQCWVVASELASTAGKPRSTAAGAVLLGLVLAVPSAEASDIIAADECDESIWQALCLNAGGRAGSSSAYSLFSATPRAGINALELGYQAKANGYGSSAVGPEAKSENFYSAAFGWRALAGASYSVAAGANAQATESFAIAMGRDSKASAMSAVAIGGQAAASGRSSVALGSSAVASAETAHALGYLSQATSQYATAVGAVSKAFGAYSIAVGNHATAIGDDAIAIGRSARTVDSSAGISRIAIGGGAFAGTGGYTGAIAIGGSASSEYDGISVGYGAKATVSGSIALGSHSLANEANSISVGNGSIKRRIVNLADARLSTTSTDAVTGKQLNATNGNVASAQAAADAARATANTANTNANTALAKANAVSGLVSQVSASGNVRLGGENTGTVLDVRNKSNAVRSITGLKDGALSTSSTEAVTGKQLNATNANVSKAQAAADATAARLNAIAVALGAGAVAEQASYGISTALGNNAKAYNGKSVAMGADARATVDDAGNKISGNAGVSIGAGTRSGNGAVALGLDAVATGDRGIAVGHEASGKGTHAMALGFQSNASANQATAVGRGAVASSLYASALGNQATATAQSALALGDRASATHAGAVALGNGSATTATNQVSVGNGSLKRKVVNVADGALSTSSSEAVTGKQLHATNTSVAAVKATADGAQARLAVLDGLVGQVSATGNMRLGADNTGTVIDVANKTGAKRKLQNLANGVLSTSSTDAVTGQQLNATNSEVTSVRTAATAAKTAADAARDVADGAVLKADALGGLVGQVSASGNVRLGAENTGTIVDVANKSGGKRRIYNIANGTLSTGSTDAVTGQQLFATNATVETQRQDLAGHAQQLADQDGRITDNRVELDTLRADFDNFDPDLDGVVKFSADRLLVDMEGARVSGVAAGDISSSASTDAVNGGQLFATNSRIGALELKDRLVDFGKELGAMEAESGLFGVALGNGAQASLRTEGGTAVGSYSTALGKNSVALGRGSLVEEIAEAGFALGAGASVAQDHGVALGSYSEVRAGAFNSVALGANSIAEEERVVSIGSSTLKRRLTNVARGTSGDNAATIAQLSESVSALGGGAGVDSNGSVVAPVYGMQGGTQNNVGDALAVLDGAVVRADGRVENIESQLRATFQQSSSTGVDGVGQLNLAGAQGMVLSNLADGRIAAGSRDAVTGNQLHATEQKIERNRRDLDAMQRDWSSDQKNLLTETSDGNLIDFGGARLTGVADAHLSADSSDVVRGSQLYSTNLRLSSIEEMGSNFAFGWIPEDWQYPAQAGPAGLAIGKNAKASLHSEGGVAVGAWATAQGKNSVALGRASYVHEQAEDGFAVGGRTQVAARGGIALGAGSEVRSNASNSVAIGYQSIADDADTVSFGNDWLKRRLTGVANGRNANDAATIGQLRGALSTLGGNIDANGNVTTPGFTVQGQHQNTVNDALTTLDSAVVTTGSRMDRVETQLRSVFQETPSTRSDGTAQLTLAGANGMVISNVANGLIAAGSREAVNGGQLHAVQQQLNGRMDGLEQRVDGQPQSRALATASAAPTEQVTPTPEASDSPQVASAGEGTSPTPQPKSKQDDTPSPTPQVDTAELEKMLARANEYTDGAISNFERRLDKMDKRFNRMAAMSSAQTAMAMNTAGLATYNRLGAGVGYAEGESAMAVGYQRVLNEKGSATFSLNGAFTNSGERSMGVGVGIGW
ncbi:ESPR-type extended signal peptide-containing protein [Stenotrophomonas maltophilia]|uniref:ESPR-type extended signal peptide-containing protein n=1 Tax=Stenotrophomonas maltophilia TaxID=40324 RepID=UPI0009B2643E|nr:ESPR-type extended signal peptide-containing protein [Stenotrophomonas maltophilia]ELK2666783.1 YadA-like family protein [Stenotrophomonas maltophilia]MBH1376349.1 YadA-like family protein [Stenotrophomonas maltophilia]MBH1439548.1 YadA-like family protein [Stenotrophomonas maltophilia]MBH1558643.1 YadA-like family protein [Stenotrophomonas maltophilia]MBN4986742.1 YadA-like family protein [Stenotrophomonas maltophilia]